MKCWCPSLRTICNSSLVIVLIALVSVIFHQLVLPIVGVLIPASVPGLYDFGVYGAYPTRPHITSDLSSPDISVVAWDESCEKGYVLVSPFGAAVPDGGPVILDSRGDLVWAATGFNIVMNLKVQEYHGEHYLTFWAGHKEGGIGIGDYYMLNASYDTVHVVKAASSDHAPRMGDLHDFVITKDNTALITIYNTTQFDLSAMGRPTEGWIVDSLFQEIDIATGEIIVEWRASEYFNPTESFYINPFGGYKESNPYDFFHINSVEKDARGGYLISSRHYHSLTYLDHTGEIIWTLGGDYNDFEDLSEGKATSFKWQHDARWVDEEQGILSLFDNGSAGPIMHDADHSLALIIQLDFEKNTARLLHSYASKDKTISASQGSVQVLSDNHVLVGWGSSAAYSEFTTSGTLLCETHLTPSILFWWERVKTYRAIKTFDWIGRPEYPPIAKMLGDKIYVSWNGATEVGAWQLEGRKNGAPETEWQTVDIQDKSGFEDIFTVPTTEEFVAYRLAALDRKGGFIMHSDNVEILVSRTSKWLWVAFALCVGLGLTGGVTLFVRKGGQNLLRIVWKPFALKGHKYNRVPSIEMT